MATSSATTGGTSFKFKISQPNLLCKNGCGHYGNEVQEGFCSLCFKEYKKKLSSGSSARRRHSRDDATGSYSRGTHGHQIPVGAEGLASTGGASATTSAGGIFSPTSTFASSISAFATLPRAAAAKLSFDQIMPSQMGSFAKFEEKKKHQTDRKGSSLRSVFRKSPTPTVKLGDSIFSPPNHASSADSSPGPAHHHSHLDVDFENLREIFNDFLHPFPIPIKRDVTVKVKDCGNELKKMSQQGVSVEDMSDATQNFYSNFRRKVDTLPIYQSMSAEDKDKLMDFIEKYFTLSLYKEMFSPISTAMEDEIKDLELQKKIRQLNWTSTEHLDICLNERDKNVRDLIWASITAIIEVDSLKAPQDKLSQIFKCSRYILDALGKSKQTGAVSADDFLPALIYIVIKANPTRLQTNMNYITRFSMADRLMSGETGYYFTNLCCAVSFIQTLNAESLNMPEEEFQSYISGEAVPPGGSWEMHFSEPVHTLQEMYGALTDLENRHGDFLKNVQVLRDTMRLSQERIADHVEEILERTPLTFKPRSRKVPTNIDEEDPDLNETSLPSPLKPQVVNAFSKKTTYAPVDDHQHSEIKGQLEHKEPWCNPEEEVPERENLSVTRAEEPGPTTSTDLSQTGETDAQPMTHNEYLPTHSTYVSDESVPIHLAPVTDESVPIPLAAVLDESAPIPLTSVPDESIPIPFASVCDESVPIPLASVPGESIPIPLASVSDEPFPIPLPSVPDESVPIPLVSVPDESLPIPLASLLDESEPIPLASVSDEAVPIHLASVPVEPVPLSLAAVPDEPVPIHLASKSDEPVPIPLASVPDESIPIHLTSESDEAIDPVLVISFEEESKVPTMLNFHCPEPQQHAETDPDLPFMHTENCAILTDPQVTSVSLSPSDPKLSE